MQKIIVIGLLVLLLGCTQKENIQKTMEVNTMKLISNDFKQQENIPSKFTCDGQNINPHLAWSDVPPEVKSFMLIVDDPDAPRKTWVHWIVINIPSSIREIQQDSIPGTQIKNDFGKENYGGPCPPSGVHRYFFKLYGLDVEKLEGVNEKNVNTIMEQHKIAEATLIGTYTRS